MQARYTKRSRVPSLMLMILFNNEILNIFFFFFFFFHVIFLMIFFLIKTGINFILIYISTIFFARIK
jgi:hypothetical protein